MPTAGLLKSSDFSQGKFTGFVIPRWGPRRVLALGGSLVGLGYVLASFAPSIGGIALCYGVIAGSGVGIAYGVPMAVAARWFPDRKGLAVGATIVGFGLSPLLTAPLAEHWIRTLGVRPTLRILGILFAAVILGIATQLKFPPPPLDPSPLSFQKVRGWPRSPAFQAIPPSPAKPIVLRPVDLLCHRHPDRLKCYWDFRPRGGGAGRSGSYLGCQQRGLFCPVQWDQPSFVGLVGRPTPTLSGHRRILRADLAGLWADASASSGISPALLGGLPRRQPERAPQTVSPLRYWVAFSLLWFCLGGWLAMAPTLTLRLFDPERYAQNYGIVFTAYGVGALTGTLITGQIRDRLGSYSYTFYGMAALALVGIGVAKVFLREKLQDLQVNRAQANKSRGRRWFP